MTLTLEDSLAILTRSLMMASPGPPERAAVWSASGLAVAAKEAVREFHGTLL